ncbi:LacI family DNA-binding transcriptional regulator [Liquorilactobacillus hordei]|uniref:LacI family DNA-binding transcriptional regulator n=1 Tax=Liquorilactobacillus hordei TaxID=468911 RepID=UPI001CC00A36|nr:LacI family DNA-binding transcriptional regulator [Liquorilactobacillus hordei]MBZ2406491.1 LacI family transcriptional regulator [Liquorilactobacillus hordei]
MSVTIKDIAKETGFSVATVSRVLSDKTGFFSQQTAAIINETAAKLGYKKNMAATELVTQKSNVVAVIVNSTKTNFSDQIINGIQKKADEAEKRVIILYAGDRNERSQRIALLTALERPILGILLLSVDLFPSNLAILTSSNIPFYFISISFKDTMLNYIASDDQEIGYQATNYLISQGHKNIGIAGLNIENSAHTGALRFKGYQKALREAGIIFKSDWLQTGDYSYESGVTALQNYYLKKDITAVIAASDLVGIGILNECNRLKINVPAELSILTTDGTSLCELVRPQLSSITQDFYRMGYLGTTYLINNTQNNAYTNITISQRQSVKSLNKIDH